MKLSFPSSFNLQNLSLKSITKSLGQQHQPMYSSSSSSSSLIWFIIILQYFLHQSIIQVVNAIDNGHISSSSSNGGGGGSGNSCPVRSLIKPCLCNEITKGLEIICEGVQLEMLKEIFDRLPVNNNNKNGVAGGSEHQKNQRTTIMYLKMKNNHIHSFPARLLNNINVRHLMAHNCNMIAVDSDAFLSIHDQIESLDLSHNKFQKVSFFSCIN